MDWTIVAAVGIPSVAAMVCVLSIPNIIAAKRHARCEHDMSATPVYDPDDSTKKIGVILICKKCAMVKKVSPDG